MSEFDSLHKDTSLNPQDSQRTVDFTTTRIEDFLLYSNSKIQKSSPVDVKYQGEGDTYWTKNSEGRYFCDENGLVFDIKSNNEWTGHYYQENQFFPCDLVQNEDSYDIQILLRDKDKNLVTKLLSVDNGGVVSQVFMQVSGEVPTTQKVSNYQAIDSKETEKLRIESGVFAENTVRTYSNIADDKDSISINQELEYADIRISNFSRVAIEDSVDLSKLHKKRIPKVNLLLKNRREKEGVQFSNIEPEVFEIYDTDGKRLTHDDLYGENSSFQENQREQPTESIFNVAFYSKMADNQRKKHPRKSFTFDSSEQIYRDILDHSRKKMKIALRQRVPDDIVRNLKSLLEEDRISIDKDKKVVGFLKNSQKFQYVPKDAHPVYFSNSAKDKKTRQKMFDAFYTELQLLKEEPELAPKATKILNDESIIEKLSPTLKIQRTIDDLKKRYQEKPTELITDQDSKIRVETRGRPKKHHFLRIQCQDPEQVQIGNSWHDLSSVPRHTFTSKQSDAEQHIFFIKIPEKPTQKPTFCQPIVSHPGGGTEFALKSTSKAAAKEILTEAAKLVRQQAQQFQTEPTYSQIEGEEHYAKISGESITAARQSQGGWLVGFDNQQESSDYSEPQDALTHENSQRRETVFKKPEPHYSVPSLARKATMCSQEGSQQRGKKVEGSHAGNLPEENADFQSNVTIYAKGESYKDPVSHNLSEGGASVKAKEVTDTYSEVKKVKRGKTAPSQTLQDPQVNPSIQEEGFLDFDV